MTDKTFGDLSRAGSLSGNELFAIENGDGNSRAILASRIRNYAQALVAADLTEHLADMNAHGISDFVETIVGAASAVSFLSLLGITYTSNGDGICLGLTFGETTVLLQAGENLSGSEGWSSAYDFPVPFATSGTTYILASKCDPNPSADEGNAISAVAISGTQYKIGLDDTGATSCNWIAFGVGA